MRSKPRSESCSDASRPLEACENESEGSGRRHATIMSRMILLSSTMSSSAMGGSKNGRDGPTQGGYTVGVGKYGVSNPRSGGPFANQPADGMVLSQRTRARL